ncbi:MAG: T9SS type A sorting domain-containing protein [Hymenobacteraceae bacterium]|nr:T9SS type A sorting domain-containing protein [Hymenobacteraceae bacterium]
MLGDRGNPISLDNLPLGTRYPGLAGEAATGVTMAVFPNPSDGNAQVRISTGRSGGATLRVYDAAGRLIGAPYAVAATGTGHTREVALQTLAGSLAPGVYVVELTAADGGRQIQRALVY